MSTELSERLKANEDLVTDQRRSWSPARWAVWIGAIVLVLALGAAGAVAYATYDYSEKYEDKLLPKSTIAGVDVSGMTRAEATQAVRSHIEPELSRNITLRYKSHRWTVTPRRLGARSDVRRAVHTAMLASDQTSFFDKLKMRMLGERLNFERSVAIKYPRKEPNAFVDRIAKGLALEPRDASLDYSTGWVHIKKEREGRRVQVAKAQHGLMKALRRDRSFVPIPVKDLQPEVTSAAYDDVLLVRIGENRLYLYEDGKITTSWPVATGQPEYMTPTGEYEIVEKRFLPTWINPAPDTWGKDLPAQIPPGPGNPLGVRALNWSAPAIRFHGTEATYSLGYNASHGCVRLSNSDVVDLYNRVDVGTPIVSVVASSLKPLYVSSLDPTPVADDGPKNGGGKKDKKA